ncbi:MAG TPA: methyltransferase domain-containing protein [Polyangia bacterium]|nr:methyltransferase domain-containing protein [Polyangia bacterium]
MTPESDSQARLARLYDGEIFPAYAGRFAALLARAITPLPGARVVEVGCATGGLTRELARRFDDRSHVTALDASPAFVAEARAKIETLPGRHARVALAAQAEIPLALPLGDGTADLVISNLALAAAADPRAAVREAVRILVPGGELALSVPLRGSWQEFLDLFRDVLRETGKSASLTAVERYVATLPTGEQVVDWLEEAGLRSVELTVERWEILFKSAREFFFSPLVELGPLAGWKRLAGRGDEMQDVFFFTKEAIDTYFDRSAFAATIVGAACGGRK